MESAAAKLHCATPRVSQHLKCCSDEDLEDSLNSVIVLALKFVLFGLRSNLRL